MFDIFDMNIEQNTPQWAQDSQNFGRMLRRERRALGKTQQEVAATIGTRRQTIAELERGGNVGSFTLFAVLAALGKGVTLRDAGHPDMETIAAMLREWDDD